MHALGCWLAARTVPADLIAPLGGSFAKGTGKDQPCFSKRLPPKPLDIKGTLRPHFWAIYQFVAGLSAFAKSPRQPRRSAREVFELLWAMPTLLVVSRDYDRNVHIVVEWLCHSSPGCDWLVCFHAMFFFLCVCMETNMQIANIADFSNIHSLG